MNQHHIHQQRKEIQTKKTRTTKPHTTIIIRRTLTTNIYNHNKRTVAPERGRRTNLANPRKSPAAREGNETTGERRGNEMKGRGDGKRTLHHQARVPKNQTGTLTTRAHMTDTQNKTTQRRQMKSRMSTQASDPTAHKSVEANPNFNRLTYSNSVA
jgi:hypothetical protein